MCVNLFFAARSLFLLAELAEHQVSREEGTKDMVTGSRLEHICLPAVHMFTPDPSQVTVWVAPSLFPSHYLHPTPSTNGFLSYCRGNSSATDQISYCSNAQRLTSITHATKLARAELPQTLKIGQIQT